MSDGNDGVLIGDDNGVYFVPGEQLAQYRLSDDEAKSVSDAVGGEVSGFMNKQDLVGAFRPVQFAFAGEFKPQTVSNTSGSDLR